MAFFLEDEEWKHSEEMREFIWRHKIYSSMWIAALKDGLKYLFQDIFYIDRSILGTYADAKDVVQASTDDNEARIELVKNTYDADRY